MNPRIIFECGPTHTGLESALKLVDVAKEAGADAIKFQMIDANRLCSDPTQMVTYTDWECRKQEPMIDVLRRRMMRPDEWLSIALRCKARELPLILTCCYEDEIDFACDDLDAAGIKIASGDIDQEGLIRYAANSAPELHLDTGNATIEEIERAINWIRSEQFEDALVVHHCPTGYPAKMDAINLRTIWLLKNLDCAVAYSCHTPGSYMAAAAIAMGAMTIEKTLTLDRRQIGPEHLMSVEPHDAAQFVDEMRAVVAAMGTGYRSFTPEQDRERRMVRRLMRNGVMSRPGI